MVLGLRGLGGSEMLVTLDASPLRFELALWLPETGPGNLASG